MSKAIVVDTVSRNFQVGSETVHALRGVSLDVEYGKLTILRGRSGSGKTTLLNILCGLDMPTSGAVTLFDTHRLTQMPEAARDRLRLREIGLVSQSIALISLMTALENVEFALRMAGMSHKERRKRATYCLELVGLTSRMTHMPSEMSGGEQQRVALARAIATSPKIIFCDEPTAELDTVTGLRIVKLLLELTREHGVTIVMTTHDPGIMELADTVYSLKDGEIVDEP